MKGDTTDTKKLNKKRKPGSGGVREGAGRKTDELKPFTMRVSLAEKAMIEAVREKKKKKIKKPL